MVQDVYDPLTEYEQVFRDRFKEVAKSTFEQLAAEAQVDVDSNRQTCSEIYQQEEQLESVGSKLNWLTALCVFLWIAIIASVAIIFFMWQGVFEIWMLCASVFDVIALLLLVIKIHPAISRLKGVKSDLEYQVDSLKAEAWRQMEPLNRLYDWDVLTRMMTQTVPRLEFDPYFTNQRLEDLVKTYGWDGSFNSGRSVLFSHSGLINGNPFVFVRTRRMEMSRKTYYGSKTIHWTTTERGSDGKYHTVYHTETLQATVTAPYPTYPEDTSLIYGNTSAPDLIFTRKKSGLASNVGGFTFNLHKRKLRKKSRDLENSDYAMLTNEEFETAFDTSDRNNNQQFALLFTPVAQQSMMKLLQDRLSGYGDDFNFIKLKMINVIEADHLQSLNLDTNPNLYKNFDFDRAKDDFLCINAAYFRAVYFSLAPLLCVPLYQQIRPASDIYGREMPTHSCFWEHEAMANFWGIDRFRHPACVTNCILKTEVSQTKRNGDEAVVTVYAHGYRSEQRLTYVPKFGGDGRWHDVPVYWDEYLPVTGKGNMELKEDNGEQNFKTQTERLNHIQDVLDASSLCLYRRHIASKA